MRHPFPEKVYHIAQRAWGCFLLFFLPVAALPAQTSTFDTDDGGWFASGDPTNTNPFWEPAGGNPGGYIRVVDAAVGGTWYFNASAEFHGNKCDAYGKYLRWDQFTSDTSTQQLVGGAPDVILDGGSLTLVFDNAQNPGLAWTHYDLLLREDAGWRLGNSNGPLPTQAQFQTVLANLGGLRIRGEYRAQADFGGLDNVVLESSFLFDLDSDNSSGEPGGGYNADTTCSASAPVADLDAGLFSQKNVDSIVLRLPFVQNVGFETFVTGFLPPEISASHIGPGWLTLVNTGGASPSDFMDALVNIRYEDHSPAPSRGTRIVSIRVYVATCGEVGQRYAYLPMYPPVSAGKDVDTVLCAGGQPLDLSVLSGTAVAGGMWQPLLPGGLFDPEKDPPGLFRYIIPDAGPCPGDTASVSIIVEQPPAFQSDTTICAGDTALLVTPPGVLHGQWRGPDGHPVSVANGPGQYIFQGQTAHCVVADSVQIGFFTCEACEFYAPNVFSPNDDGLNDDWQLFFPCTWQRFRVEIFDRWGNLVFAADNPAARWNGDWQGEPAAQGVYVWQVEWDSELFGEPRRYRQGGDVTLLR